MTEPLVTVVTVVHNGEQHLGACIESVLGQTYSNWEYVVIDNCSTDRTPEIVEEYARDERRLRYERHEEFTDVVSSHNRGFRAIGPESAYCKFVGADDWIYPDCLTCMVKLAEAHPDVGTVGSYRLNGDQVDLVLFPHSQATQPGRLLLADSLRSPMALTGSPTALLYRSALVRSRDPFFDETFRHADSEAAYWLLMRSDFGLVHQVLTYNRKSPETQRSDRIGSYEPERLRLLFRYGREVLPADVYRREVRSKLRTYLKLQLRVWAWWHTKRHLPGSQDLDPDFWAFHRRTLALAFEEVGDDPEARRALAFVRLLLR